MSILTVSVENSFSSDPPIYAVWASPAENRRTVIQYAHKEQGGWRKVQQLAINEGLHVTPVIAADTHHTVWIVWIEQTAEENILRYAVIRQGKMKTGRVRTAVNEQSYAPAIMVDNQENPWIAWSAVAGKSMADIYTSRWNGTDWEKPIMVNEKNQVPDITPILGLKEGRLPWVSWFGFNSAHRYVQFTAKWQDGGWRVDKKNLESKNIIIFIHQKTGVNVQLPHQALHRLMGAVFLNQGNEIQSISERFIRLQTSESGK